MRLLMITQRVDPRHDILGFVLGWIEALADQVDALEVIAQEVPEPAWRSEHEGVSILSLGKERGHGKWRQGMRLQGLLASRLSGVGRLSGAGRPDAIFCHMCPEYVVYSAPLARLGRIPTFLWYTHGTATPMLRRACALATRTFTAARADFPLDFSRQPGRLTELGHGIDIDRFPSAGLPQGAGRTILSIGRISPIKNHLCVVRGFARWLERNPHPDHRLRIVGGPPVAEHASTLEELEREIAALGVADRTDLVGAIPYSQVYQELVRGHILVSASQTRSLDKVVLEAMAAGRPILTCNPAFRNELARNEMALDGEELMFRPGDAEDLARRLSALAARPLDELEDLGRRLATSVRRRHGLGAFAERLVEAMAG